MTTQNQPKSQAAPEAAKYRCEYNKVGDWWRTFYYCPGAGFDYGSEVYYGRNDWRTEAQAISAKEKWEMRNR